MEQVIIGDCLDVLKNWPSNSVGMVYLDPPFFTQKTHTLKSRDLTEEYQFDDKWDDLPHYLQFLRIRLVEIKRVMSDTASVFFHCDRTASHHVRFLLEEIFGSGRFLSEIIWFYRRWSNSQRSLLGSHQTIYMFSKTENYTFHTLTQDYSETTNLDQILQKRFRDADGKTIYARSERGEVILNGPKKGVPLTDVWEIPYLNPKAKERTGYPTQKPLLLLERIIDLASNPGDLVLDPFCGSGTTLVAAASLNRDYLGIDVSERAVQLTLSRLNNPIKSGSNLLKVGRSAYDNLPGYVKDILSELSVKNIQRNSGIDALYDEFIEGRPVVIRVQRKGESLIDAAHRLASAGRKRAAKLMILIQTDLKSDSLLIDLMPEDVKVVKSTKVSISQIVQQCHRVEPT